MTCASPSGMELKARNVARQSSPVRYPLAHLAQTDFLINPSLQTDRRAGRISNNSIPSDLDTGSGEGCTQLVGMTIHSRRDPMLRKIQSDLFSATLE